MTAYKQGDVVLVSFIFSDESGAKRRPAIVVSTEGHHQGRQEVIIAAVTSNVDRLLPGDYLIANWQKARLLSPSVATGIIRTVKETMIARRLGAVSTEDRRAIQGQLKQILGL
jgi:mRNA-degrading endonuclease toxin of MazEF toxin-antitoxin module